MTRFLKEINDLHSSRRDQILELWDKVAKRSEEQRTSLGARNIEEADILFLGYLLRYKNLMSKLNELDVEYMEIYSSLARVSKWYSIFGWLPFIKVNKDTLQLIQQFKAKWEKYEPGW